jgi:hypothetical protein
MERKGFLSFGWAWIALSLALACHVTDEALTNFLSVYNPAVLAVRGCLPFLPIPTFTFKVWLSGLVLGIALLLMLSPFAFRHTRWLTIPAYLLGIMMLGNGLQHILASLYMQRWMPGVYSSPLLIASSVYLLLSVRNERRRTANSLCENSPRRRSNDLIDDPD